MTSKTSHEDTAFERFILTHLPLSAVPGLPIRLHLARPQSGLARFLGPDGETPYWAYPWAGGLALAHHLIAHPDLVAGRTILDFGAGSGLVGIVAAHLGAARVIAVEINPLARRVIALNAFANSAFVEFADEGPDFGELPGIDLMLAGDVFYDRSVVASVLGALNAALSAGTVVLVGDPGRPDLPRDRLVEIADYAVGDVGKPVGSATTGMVFRLARDHARPIFTPHSAFKRT